MKKKRPPGSDLPTDPSHNEFFCGMYSLEEVAMAHVGMVLSPEELAELDLNKATLLAGSYVEGDLKATFSDIVWQCPLKNADNLVKVAFLFEHKSSPPSQPIEVQLLQYFLGIWRREVANGQSPSVIVAIVVYHGARPWSTPSLSDLLRNVPFIFRKYVLQVNFIFTNVSLLPDSFIKTNEAIGVLRSVLLALKYAFDAPKMKQNFVDIAIFAVGKREEPSNEIFLEMLFTYVQKRLDMEVREMENLIESLPEEPRAVALSTYDKIVEKGRQQGLQEGRQRGLQEGRQQGLQEGIQLGIQQEREASKERFALVLIRQTDMSDKQIAQMVGLEVAHVTALRKKAAE
ncbi:MAG: Rpn family recombination-promoting nuclease/putative transposase [Saprospiraceae bacterium]|nr:Rpn family recombination-promoting nuclease/putative transposase [Saprospiraceae bacterium]